MALSHDVDDVFEFPLPLDNTPMLKQQVDEMEASAKRLKDRVSALLAGAKKYRDGITAMHEAQLAFAAALTEFGGGSDEESLHLGSAVMSQFIKVFRELAGFYEFLRTQLDLGLIERLQKDWLEGTLAAQREERRRHDRKAAEYDAARVKHQALKKVTKREVLERSHSDLAAARCAEEAARFDLARRIAEVELSKRYGFMELVVSAVHAHLMFFRNGSETLGRLEGPINDALAIGEALRGREAARMRDLEGMISARREAADRREALIAAEVASLEGGSGTGSGSGASGGGASSAGAAGGEGGTGGAPSGAAAGSPCAAAAPAPPATLQGGPIQMRSSNSELLADIERLIGATRTSGGVQVTIIKQGYLSKRSQGKSRAEFKRRYFVLDSNGMLYYYSHKADSLMQLSRSVRPKNTLPLLTSTVKMDADDPGVRCAFRVVSPEGTYTLQAESEFERSEWIAALQSVINTLLSGEVDMDALPRVPVRPTHSRTGSHADAVLAGGGSGGPAGLRRASHTSGSGAGPGSSQPGTPAADVALASIASGDGGDASGSDGGGGAEGHHPQQARVPSRLSGAKGGGGSAGAHGGGEAAGHGEGGGAAAATGGGSVMLERLRAIPGNRRCVDCGAPDPDWASLNLGVLMCIECSGVHRQLGVQVSKVRSCTLDVRAWEPPVLAVFEAVGNAYANSVWEAALPATAAGAGAAAGAAASSSGVGGPGAEAGASGVPCDGGGGGGAAGGGAALAAAGAGPPPPARPAPSAPLPDKARFIRDKYAARAYVGPLPREAAQARLWDAVAARDVRGAVAALAAGADINAPYRTPRAQRLVAEAATRASAGDARAGGGSGDGGGGGGEGGSGSGSGSGSGDGGGATTVCGCVTVLHLASVSGDIPMMEFLLQNGASWQHTDAHGRTPLHYAVLHDSAEAAKLLMRRGGDGSELQQRARDTRGRTPMDLAMLKGRVTDEELFLLLSG
ncbi:hypothetical protein Rsub_05121 [Raphidocelis subcapitata]|uniref:Uncharacterized protein n=1 Tax=Raphidocelis subcapitata TaxID=307507 RepID=A0A2V0P1E9_9CHLO|nr:hypothetical protein Rsub_05121 [Raphidocelis subcapitata]|eukprot:GBF92752.1 hypothetical protein Rsub_05121 [Raphidocelis subcapitata]